MNKQKVFDSVKKSLPYAGGFGLALLIAPIDGGTSLIKSSGVTIGAIVKFAAVGVVGYATTKVLLTPQAEERIEQIANAILEKMEAKMATEQPATA